MGKSSLVLSNAVPRKIERTRWPRATLMCKALFELEQVKAARCRRHLFYFMQEFWDCVSTEQPKWNWHIEYLCDQLEKVARRVAANLPKEHDLIINIPPGMTKSITCSIMYPVWCWTNWYWMRFICASYGEKLSLELAEYSRELVRSDKFHSYFPELDIKQDKDQKGNFRLVYTQPNGVKQMGGSRFSTSVGGALTGFHAHIQIVDDPVKPPDKRKALSTAELVTANHWIDQTLSTRKIDKEITPLVMIMQRLHQEDPTGHILNKKKSNVLHISLPGEITSYRDYVRPVELLLHYKDNLLDPSRLSWNVLKDMESTLGQYGYAGQVGQNPVPPTGGMFKVDRFQIITDLPNDVNFVQFVRYWDKAGSKDSGAYTAGVKILSLKNGKYVIVDVKHGQWATETRESIIRETAEADGKNVIVVTEQEPGSGGKESAEGTIRNLSGFSVHADRPTGDKIFRADPYSVQVNSGNVMLLRGDWNHDFIEEHRFFPFGRYKDQVDAAAGAFNRLAAKKLVHTFGSLHG